MDLQLKPDIISQNSIDRIEEKLLEKINDKYFYKQAKKCLDNFKNGNWAWNTLRNNICSILLGSTAYRFPEDTNNYITLRILENYYEEVYERPFDRWSLPPQVRYLFEYTPDEDVDIYSNEKEPNPEFKTNTNKPLKEKNMAQPIKIEVKTFVNGDDVTDLSDDQIFTLIARAEKDVEKLEAVQNKPKKLEQKIADFKKSIEDLAKLVDERD